MEDGLSYILVPYQTTSIAVCNIVDVFPYFGNDANQSVPSNLKPLSQVTKSQVFEDEDLDVVYSAGEDEVEDEDEDGVEDGVDSGDVGWIYDPEDWTCKDGSVIKWRRKIK